MLSTSIGLYKDKVYASMLSNAWPKKWFVGRGPQKYAGGVNEAVRWMER